MATIEEMESKMTVIYNKRTGSIKTILGGIQSVKIYFGNEGEDYMLIYQELIVDRDEYVMSNKDSFKVNIELERVEMLSVITPNYPIANN